jgi:putative transposase
VRKRQRRQSGRYLGLLPKVEEIKGGHPAWGYRKITAYLARMLHIPCNHKAIFRLMKDNGLCVPKNLRLRAKREAKTSKPVTDMPNLLWGIDMTKVQTLHDGWVYIHNVIDWGSKKLVASLPSQTSRTEDWKAALGMAVNMQFPNGIKNVEYYTVIPSLVSDNGCQPTSKAFRKHAETLGMPQIFTCFSNPKGNADTERIMRTMKEDLFWTAEFNTFSEVKAAVEKWQHDYNYTFPHSSLAYYTPVQYEEAFWNNEEPQNTRSKKIMSQRASLIQGAI